MNRESAELWSGAIGSAGTVIRYGHWGRPALAFPSEGGHATDFENNGMVDAVAGLIDAGSFGIRLANCAAFLSPTLRLVTIRLNCPECASSAASAHEDT